MIMVLLLSSLCRDICDHVGPSTDAVYFVDSAVSPPKTFGEPPHTFDRRIDFSSPQALNTADAPG
jgi:hypothetical protein